MPDLQPGDTLDHYQLKELLAKSGMASIFEAVDTETGKAVALKIPHLYFEGDVVFFERFRREQSVGERLDHPGVIKVFPARKTSRTYLAMELVEGKSLRAVMRAEGRLPVGRALDFARQLAEVLVYLHANGVVHRDLKPENILVMPDGKIKLLDFGIALDETARRLTWFGLSNTVGTPDYMAPEQVNGRRGDVRTDIYALGTILYEMITREVPFVAANAQAILRAKTSEDARPPRQILPDLDPKIEEIILHAVERDPRDRYARASEFLADLQDPSKVVLRDRSEILARHRRILGLERQTFFRTFIALVLCMLLGLVWLTHRRAAHAPSGAPRSGATIP